MSLLNTDQSTIQDTRGASACITVSLLPCRAGRRVLNALEKSKNIMSASRPIQMCKGMVKQEDEAVFHSHCLAGRQTEGGQRCDRTSLSRVFIRWEVSVSVVVEGLSFHLLFCYRAAVLPRP